MKTWISVVRFTTMDAHLFVVLVLVCFLVNFADGKVQHRIERSVERLEYAIPENYTFIDVGLEIHNQLHVFFEDFVWVIESFE
jgi:hypothetical protein